MLFRNHEQKVYKLSKEDEKELMEAIGKWPVTITFVPELSKPSSNPNNRIPDQPPFVIVKTTWPVNEGDGSAVYTYANNFVYDPEAKKNVTKPDSIEFTGSQTFRESDKELVWFLWRCYPGFRGGKNNSGARNKDHIMFHLPHLNRQKTVAYEKRLAYAKNLILDDKEGILLPDLKNVARAFFIPEVDTMGLDDVQAALLGVLQSGKTEQEKLEAIDKFMLVADNKESVRVRSVIQQAIDKKYIAWDTVRRRWNRLEDKKVMDAPIMVVSMAAKDPREALFEMCAGTREGRELIDILEETLDLKEKKENTGDE